jgi:hypothetical protein
VKVPHLSDPLLTAIAALPVVPPDAGRSDAIRTRCRATLESGRTNGESPLLEPAAAVACAAYALQLARLALLLSR